MKRTRSGGRRRGQRCPRRLRKVLTDCDCNDEKKAANQRATIEEQSDVCAAFTEL